RLFHFHVRVQAGEVLDPRCNEPLGGLEAGDHEVALQLAFGLVGREPGIDARWLCLRLDAIPWPRRQPGDRENEPDDVRSMAVTHVQLLRSWNFSRSDRVAVLGAPVEWWWVSARGKL